MKTIQTKTLFIALLLSTATPSLRAEMEQVQMDLQVQMDFWQAINEGSLIGVKQALESGADVNKMNEDGWTALGYLANFGKTELAVEMIELLLKNDANPDEEDEDDRTALMFAVNEGHLKIAKLLLEYGADFDKRDMFNWTALMKAAYKEYPKIVKLLLEKGADVNLKNGEGNTALKIAEKRGNTGIVKVIKDFVIKRRKEVAETVLEVRKEVYPEIGGLISEFETGLEK